MRLRSACAVLALCFSFAAPGIAAPLQPTSNWDLDYGDTQCTAGRTFGPADNSVVLGIVPSLDSQTYKLIVSVERPGPRFAQQTEGSVSWGAQTIKARVLHFGKVGLKLSAYQARIPAADVERMRQATTIELRSGTGENYQFAVTGMSALVDALHKCSADLRQYWNTAPAVIASMKKGAAGDIEDAFVSGFYPPESLVRGQHGTVQFELMIDEKGTVAGCDVRRDSGIAQVDAEACDILHAKAKFSPAIDATGKPVRSVVLSPPFTWTLGTPPPSSGTFLSGKPLSL